MKLLLIYCLYAPTLQPQRLPKENYYLLLPMNKNMYNKYPLWAAPLNTTKANRQSHLTSKRLKRVNNSIAWDRSKQTTLMPDAE